MTRDFRALADRLLANAPAILSEWFPAGKIKGGRFYIGDLSGSPGDSLSVDMSIGCWSDFADGATGGDLIDLYSMANKISLAEAYDRLSDAPLPQTTPPPKKQAEMKLLPAPKDAIPPSHDYSYYDTDGRFCFGIIKTVKGNKKQFYTHSWDSISKAWVPKAWPRQRPLFGLPIPPHPRQILVVEGEKCAIFANGLLESMHVVTWAGGANAYNKTDWAPLKGRSVVIFPDNDTPGIKAANEIAKILGPKTKLIDPSGLPDGGDIVDLAPRTQQDFLAWAKPRIKSGQTLAVRAGNDAAEIAKKKIESQQVQNAPEKKKAASTAITIEDKQKRMAWGTDISSHGGVRAKGVKHYALTGIDPEDILFNASEKGISIRYTPFAVFFAVQLAFRSHFRYNEDEDAIYTNFSSDEWEIMLDHHYDYVFNVFCMKFQKHFPGPKKEHVTSAVNQCAMANKYSPLNEFVDAIPEWDGKKRVENFAKTYLGAKDKPCNRERIKKFLVSVIAKVRGMKVDFILVLFSEKQGTGKTSATEALGGDLYASVRDHIDSTDFLRASRGNLIVEGPEQIIFKGLDADEIKAVITERKTSYIAKYSNNAIKQTRRFSIIATTNKRNIVPDSQSHRRYKIIEVGDDIDWESIKRDRLQIFAEAKHHLDSGYQYWADDVYNEDNSRYVEEHPWTPVVREWLQSHVNRHTRPTTTEMLRDVIGIETKFMSRADSIDIGKILRGLGARVTKSSEGSRAWIFDQRPETYLDD